ncbi:ATP-binding mismatch repair protein [Paecilomyces lecythidis]|uniref:ATP-binding mismatch repair protein n=1 Tax=Paecilomyces lecythidis TaxID=3004212 RepID=A0ABR3Y8A8_9EURO
MATIKAIEARSIHQIQSGQVIVDLCSVVKELVENSLDAGATSVEVRFKNNGLDLIEVQDNGSGISPNNYENVALKHYTSKLSSYGDLSSLQTFGFRGEALSSLCALSNFHVVTAQVDQAPKATRLDFEFSGKLKKTQVVAGQKGTTVSVENLFQKLPVRRRELEKNIKREYGKVLGLLHAYACISTGVRFSVKNTVGKNKNVVVFTTKANPTTKENIANVYGAKTLLALIPLELELEFEPSAAGRRKAEQDVNKILVRGHISRPVFGEGRQTPDRQMFFVNSRPCGLPQIAKAFNEVYKSFNVSQSPFIFADFRMDTNAYDVNVSPDKRTILLHDSGALIEALKESLVRLFEEADQTVPQARFQPPKQVVLDQHLQVGSQDTRNPANSADLEDHVDDEPHDVPSEDDQTRHDKAQAKMKSFLSGLADRRVSAPEQAVAESPSREAIRVTQGTTQEEEHLSQELQKGDDEASMDGDGNEPQQDAPRVTNELFVEDGPPSSSPSRNEQTIPALRASSQQETPNVIQNAFDRMRHRRQPAEIATITVGDRTVTSVIGSGGSKKSNLEATGSPSGPLRSKRRVHTPSRPNIFGQSLKAFAAPGTQVGPSSDREEDEEEDEQDEDEYIGNAEEGGEENEEGQEEEEDTRLSPEPDQSISDTEEHAEQAQPDEPAIDEAETGVGDVSAESDEDYVDEEEKKARDEARVQDLIREAEANAALPSQNNTNRAEKLTKGLTRKDSTVHLMGMINGSISRIESQLNTLRHSLKACSSTTVTSDEDQEETSRTAEERLSLTVSKDDFSQMRIIGQFNLGFILATRSSAPSSSRDELFIIDQHASDEKYNFERLQAETVVQNQRLVRPKTLDLTAVEEEIIIENRGALEKNGFIIEVDDSGDEPIGRRCKLVSLPLSKEVVFDVRDLEELLVLLSETPATKTTSSTGASDIYTPRPSKVRKMFAMRACRSSIMIGKSLTLKQMEKVVRHMGTIDKPWNCPHGRPTMRHLMTLGQWNEWDENQIEDDPESDDLDVWKRYFEDHGEEEDIEDEQEEEEL